MKKLLSFILSFIAVFTIFPTMVQAQETLDVGVLSAEPHENGVLIRTVGTEQECPLELLYAISQDGQFIWEGRKEVTGAELETVLEIPVSKIVKGTYDLVVWAEKEDTNGIQRSSQVYAFKIELGSDLPDFQIIPKTAQAKTMVVQVPFAYVAASASTMDNPICFLKSGDVVQVYGDVKREPVVFIAMGDMRGYVYSRVLSSEIFDLNGEIGAKAVEIAMTRVGDPYSQPFAGTGRYLDCSYLAMWTYRQLGIDLPRTAAAQGQFLQREGAIVAKSELQPGDLIFWSYEKNGRYMDISHVGVYAGDGKTIEAVNPRLGVVYRNMPGVNKIVFCARPSKLAG